MPAPQKASGLPTFVAAKAPDVHDFRRGNRRDDLSYKLLPGRSEPRRVKKLQGRRKKRRRALGYKKSGHAPRVTTSELGGARLQPK
jgi:hypothetical protein